MIEERICSYEVATLLKEKGFDIGCYGRYSIRSKEFHFDATRKCENHGLFIIAAPTHQMACDWFMTKDIYICPKYCCFQRCKKNDKPCCKWEPTILSLLSSAPLYPQPLDMCEYYDTFGEAIEAALKYSLENLI